MVGWRRRWGRRHKLVVAVAVLRRSNSEEKGGKKSLQHNKSGWEEEEEEEEMQFCWKKVGEGREMEWYVKLVVTGGSERELHPLSPASVFDAAGDTLAYWRLTKQQNDAQDASSEQRIIKAATASWPSNREGGGGGLGTYVTAWNLILELRNGEWKQGLGKKKTVMQTCSGGVEREKERKRDGGGLENTRRWIQQQPRPLSVNCVCERVGGHNALTLATSSTGSLAAPGSAVWSVCRQERESPFNNNSDDNNTITTKCLIWYSNSCNSLSRVFDTPEIKTELME